MLQQLSVGFGVSVIAKRYQRRVRRLSVTLIYLLFLKVADE